MSFEAFAWSTEYIWIHPDTKSEIKSGTIQYGRGPTEGLHELNTN